MLFEPVSNKIIQYNIWFPVPFPTSHIDRSGVSSSAVGSPTTILLANQRSVSELVIVYNGGS